MTEADVLKILKIDLQISTSAMDEHLAALVQSAKSFIGAEGVTLQNTVDDWMLVEMYAAYLYRRRREENAAMPRMLRWALNNRLLSEKAGEKNG